MRCGWRPSSAPACSPTASSPAPVGASKDQQDLNLFAGQGVAVRETIMKPGHGRTDNLLYVDQRAVGVKPEGTPLSGVEWQPTMYAEGLPAEVRLKALTVEGRLPSCSRRRVRKRT
ncbi:MAG: hypothetical protein ACR2JO_08570 [Mycobacteriales bacterium]